MDTRLRLSVCTSTAVQASRAGIIPRCIHTIFDELRETTEVRTPTCNSLAMLIYVHHGFVNRTARACAGSFCRATLSQCLTWRSTTKSWQIYWRRNKLSWR